MDTVGQIVLIIAAGYVIGAFPTGYLVGRHLGVNIFEIGSGNMGATNIIRASGGIGWGIFVWALDSLKGIIAILVAGQIMPEHTVTATVIGAISAIVGHNWSLFIALITGRVRGGKGAATAFSTLFMIVPLYIIAAMLVIGGLIVAATRYVSLAVLLMFGMATLWVIVLTTQQLVPWEYAVYLMVIAAMIMFRFRDNIQRLIAGTERRLGEHT